MKFLVDMLDKARPLFEKGGKLEKLHPLFEANESFLFVPEGRTAEGCHIRDALDIKRLMSMVILALVPTMLVGMYNVGYQSYLAQGGQAAVAAAGHLGCMLVGARYMMPIIIMSYVAGGVWEVAFALIRKHEINEGFLVTGLLFPLILPPTIPLWQVAVAVSFGVVIGKEVFGGTGMNVFNPALVARAFLFFAYPAKISGDRVWTVIGDKVVDAYSGATPLAVAAAGGKEPVVQALANFGQTAAGRLADFSPTNMFVGLVPGSMGEVSTLAILLGAAILVIAGVGSWRIMLSCTIGALVAGTAMWAGAKGGNPSSIMALPPCYHLVMGGFAFGAVFMATDPVSASATNTGKWIYGFLIGVLAVIVRCINPAYPEGMMLSILFMNAFAPLIDHFVVKRHMSARLARMQPAAG